MGAPTEGHDPDALHLDAEGQAERMTRRVRALERQLEIRIDQVEDLKRQVAHYKRMSQDPRSGAEIEQLEHKAAEYDALMSTFALRVLRRPRSWYGMFRRRITGAP